ncbi:MAG: hypothetical protein EOP49_05285 [Sphingobacteriales bacterium]|nr:MAG: hypothetical protein EOP49_05285 [Sphingobacteriales bacterium]
MEEKHISEQESLRLIQEMIGKAKSHFHESGASSMLWGTVIGVCGLVSFAEQQWNFSIGFDIWILTLAAIIPGVWFNIRESKRRMVKTHQEVATNMVWNVFGISIVCLVLYGNIIPGVSERLFASEHIELLSRNTLTGETTHYRPSTLSLSSIFLVIYAFPTLATGLITKFRPMTIGAVLCYCFFIASLFTSFKYDMLLSGLAGIGNWLIPGLILNSRYRKAKSANV